MRTYRLTPAAKAHLMDIWEYTAINWSEKQADEYLRKIDVKLRALADCPTIGKYRPEIAQGYYSFPIERHVAY